jgi:GNAT superfamily N-acetyltransferase
MTASRKASTLSHAYDIASTLCGLGAAVLLFAAFLVIVFPVVLGAPLIALAWAHVHSETILVASEILYGLLLALAWIIFATKDVRLLLEGGDARRYVLFFVAFCPLPLLVSVFLASFSLYAFLDLSREPSGHPLSYLSLFCILLYALAGLLLAAGIQKVSTRAGWRLVRAHRRANPRLRSFGRPYGRWPRLFNGCSVISRRIRAAFTPVGRLVRDQHDRAGMHTLCYENLPCMACERDPLSLYRPPVGASSIGSGVTPMPIIRVAIVRTTAHDLPQAVMAAIVALAESELGPGYLDRRQLLANCRTVAYAVDESEHLMGFAVARFTTAATIGQEHPAAREALAEFDWMGLAETVVVAPGARRCGLGERLLRAVLEEAAPVPSPHGPILLPAWQHPDGSVPADRLARRLGFQPLTDVPDYWLADSQARGYQCPVCGNPCHCAATLYLLSDVPPPL